MNKKIQPHFFAAAAPLFLILFIDAMGLGLVFPLLNALIMEPSSGFISTSLTEAGRNMAFGLTVGIYMLSWFFGAAILGDLSDQVGRKKSLMLCLAGSFFGYLLSAIAVLLHSLPLLIAGRVIAGLSAGSQPIAQAAIVDISTPEHKARNLGFILFAISIGLIFGPLLGGVLSDADVFSGFNFATPFYFATLLSLLNAGLLWKFFNETSRHTGKIHLKPYRAVEIFISAFQHEKVKLLSFLFLIFVFGWSCYYSFISLFLLKVYRFDSLDIAYFMTIMGIGMVISNGFLVGFFTKRISLKKNAVVFAILTSLLVSLLVGTHDPIFAWILAAPIASTGAIVYSVLLTIFSNQVDADSQGWIMGITGAIMAFAFGISGIIVANLADWSVKLPLIIAATGLGLAGILMHFLHHEK